jgi:hypothetical protein
VVPRSTKRLNLPYSGVGTLEKALTFKKKVKIQFKSRPSSKEHVIRNAIENVLTFSNIKRATKQVAGLYFYSMMFSKDYNDLNITVHEDFKQSCVLSKSRDARVLSSSVSPRSS